MENVTAIAGNLSVSSTLTAMTDLRDKANLTMRDLEVLPKSTPNTSLGLVYTNPTIPENNRLVNSAYGLLLGNAALQSSLCGNIYYGASELNSLLISTINGLNNFSSATFSSSVASVLQSISNLSNDITAMDSSIASSLMSVTYITAVNWLLRMFYLLVIAVLFLIVVYVVLTKRLR